VNFLHGSIFHGAIGAEAHETKAIAEITHAKEHTILFMMFPFHPVFPVELYQKLIPRPTPIRSHCSRSDTADQAPPRGDPVQHAGVEFEAGADGVEVIEAQHVPVRPK